MIGTTVKVGYDGSEIARGLAGIRGQFAKVGTAIKADFKRLAIFGGIAGAAGVGIAKNMLDITSEFEKALTVLETIEGSGDKAKTAFSWIQDFAQNTPYELKDVTDAFVRLKAYGIDPIKDDMLRTLGDTASAMGKDVMDAVEAIADAVTGENERLKEFGIKASKDGGKIIYQYTDRLGRQLTKTAEANSRDQIKATLAAIWNEKYAGAMDKQSKTWGGMISNMKDSWARFAYQVMMSGPFDRLKAKLQELLNKVNEMAQNGELQRWAEIVGKWMTDAGEKIMKTAAEIWSAISAVKDFVGGWKNLAIAIVAINFASTIKSVIELSAAMKTLGVATWSAAGPWVALAAAVAYMVSAVGDGNFVKGLKTIGEALGGEAKAIGRSITGQPPVSNYNPPAFSPSTDASEKAARQLEETNRILKDIRKQGNVTVWA